MTPPINEPPSANRASDDADRRPDVPQAVRVPTELRHSAALRLVPPDSADRHDAARRLVAGARAAGIDLSLIFGTIERAGRGRPAWVRHAVLTVIGAGRTAMVFQGSSRGEESREDLSERVACLNAAQVGLSDLRSDDDGRARVCILQSLPEPTDIEGVESLQAAGFQHVGDLAYLRRSLHRGEASYDLKLPRGFDARALTTLDRGSSDRRDLAVALEASYEDTLDCPELCGLREVEDVIDSHAATGRFDPSLWWVLRKEGGPVGCALFSPVPETRSSELVYLGLAPSARGHGIGRSMMRYGIAALAKSTTATELLCAVDERNVPALGLYESLGFRSFSSRRAFVKSVTDTGGPVTPPENA